MSRLPATLERLWNLAGGDPRDSEADWNATFDPVGLILLAPPRNFGYWCTPTNSTTFATTGGDGVHFGWVGLPIQDVDFWPIVMTVPMWDSSNLIVGASLREFLALGCRFGYFSLEQLVYDFPNTVAILRSGEFDEEAGGTERALLARLTSEFSLVPWPDPESRLQALQEQFSSALELPDRDGVEQSGNE